MIESQYLTFSLLVSLATLLVCSYTKMGYSGNAEPSFIVPTAIATAEDSGGVAKGGKEGLSDLDFHFGNEVRER